MPFPLAPVAILGVGMALAALATSKKEAAPASPPLPSPPAGGGAPPFTDAERAAAQQVMAKGDSNEAWNLARIEYALMLATLDTSAKAARDQIVKDLLVSANAGRAKVGAKPLPYPPPPYPDPEYAIPPVDAKGPGASKEQGSPPVAPPIGTTPPLTIPPPLPGMPPIQVPPIPVPIGQTPPNVVPPPPPPDVPKVPPPAPPSPPAPPGPPLVIPPPLPGMPPIQVSPPAPPAPPTPPAPPAPPVGPVAGLPYKVKNGVPVYTTVMGDYGAKIASKFNRPSSEVPLLVKVNPQVGDWTKLGVGVELNVPLSWVPAVQPAVPPPVPYVPPLPGMPPVATPPVAIPPAPPAQKANTLANGQPFPVGGFRDPSGAPRYTIQAGDYGGKIVSKWGRPSSDVTAMIKENPGFNFSTGKAGDVIKIPSSWAS